MKHGQEGLLSVFFLPGKGICRNRPSVDFLIQSAECLRIEKFCDAQAKAVRQLFQCDDTKIVGLTVQEIIDRGLRDRRQFTHAVNRDIPLSAQSNDSGPYHIRNPHDGSPFRFLPHYHSWRKRIVGIRLTY